MNYNELTVIVPTMNEEGSIGRLISVLTKLYPGVHVVVSDDGSTDRTKAIVMDAGRRNKSILFLDRSEEKVHGLTASVVDAAAVAKSQYIVVMDGDLQHPPRMVGALYSKLWSVDLAVAVRSSVKKWSLYRTIVSRGITAVALVVFRLRRKPTVSDMMSGFFGVRTSLFKGLIRRGRRGFVMRGYKVLLDTLRMLGKDATIAEVPYSTFSERKSGRSKFKPEHMLDTLESIFRA